MEESDDLVGSLEKVREDVQKEEKNSELNDYEVKECTTKSFVESPDVDHTENAEERDVVDVKNTNNESMVDECKEVKPGALKLDCDKKLGKCHTNGNGRSNCTLLQSYGTQSVGAEAVPGGMAKNECAFS